LRSWAARQACGQGQQCVDTADSHASYDQHYPALLGLDNAHPRNTSASISASAAFSRRNYRALRNGRGGKAEGGVWFRGNSY
jgi:hypothetical protein